MKLMKKTLALCLTLVMLFSSMVFTGVNASAIAGGGLPDANNLTYSFGCDLSTWNVGGANTLDYSLVNFEKMKADGCEFAILRIALEYSSGTQSIDLAVLEYYKRARAAGMQLGAYFYSHSTTYAGAKADAEYVISIIEENDMYFEYPIYYDVEESDQTALSKTNFTNLCLGWCETMEANGYLPGVYATLTNINNKLTDDFKSKYETWGARVKVNEYTGSTSNQYGPYDYAYYENAGMWQYSFYDYEYDGIGLDMLDVNVCYKDYPAITAQYGYNNCAPAVDKTALKAAIDAAQAISYTDYNEFQLRAVRTGYGTALDVYYANGATQTEVDNAAAELNSLLANKGSNSGGIRVNGLNEKITDGDCHLFTSAFDTYPTTSDWEVSVSNANIAYTLNVVCKWDDARQAWVVKSKSEGNGTSTPSIILAKDEILFACHYSTTILDSQTSHSLLAAANVGDMVEFYGITLQGSNQRVSVGAYIRISDGTQDNLVSDKTPVISGIGTGAGSYNANLTDGIASWNVIDAANNWFGFKAVDGSNTEAANGKYVGTITFDLGTAYDISEVKLHLANIYEYGVPTPWGITLSVSEDGKTFSDPVDFPLCNGSRTEMTHYNEYAYWSVLSDTGLSGRYVRISVGVNGSWAFLNEIEVYGNAHTCGEGEWVVTKEATTTEEGEKQRICSCGKVLETAVIPMVEEEIPSYIVGDVNADGKLNGTDYLLLKRIVMGSLNAEDLKYPETAHARCDLTGDGEIKATDYFKLKRTILT